MPKYTYNCKSCDSSYRLYKSIYDSTTECSGCGGVMNRQMPKSSASDVSETVDKYTNRQHKTDHSKIMNARKLEYYWTVEVPRFVASGTYSMETMLENGWVYFNDKKKMIVNDKPPHRR